MPLPGQQSYIYRLTHNGIVSYVEPATTLASGSWTVPVVVPISGSGGTNFSINLQTFFPAITPALAVALTIQDVSSPGIGFWIRGESGSSLTGFQIRPGAIFSAGVDTIGTIYIDNLSATAILELDITVSGS